VRRFLAVYCQVIWVLSLRLRLLPATCSGRAEAPGDTTPSFNYKAAIYRPSCSLVSGSEQIYWGEPPQRETLNGPDNGFILFLNAAIWKVFFDQPQRGGWWAFPSFQRCNHPSAAADPASTLHNGAR